MSFLRGCLRQSSVAARPLRLRAGVRPSMASAVRSYATAVESESLVREKQIKELLARIPKLSDVTEANSDEVLKNMAALKALVWERQASLIVTAEEKSLVDENNTVLQGLKVDGEQGKIVDKIPIESADGHVEYKVVREGQQEGWEKIYYFGFIPTMALMGLLFIFKDDTNISTWALEELRLQTEQKYLEDRDDYRELVGGTVEDERKRHSIIVERVLAGNYDELVSN
ncbi:uncharacterized protein V1510DRAFT_410667 [Dipodascopsis tothii]|uniref:uncharacterized protein n=1 Tax=Dipodascopsis tothii TaxID=44089 RepID=UPI0034CF18DF